MECLGVSGLALEQHLDNLLEVPFELVMARSIAASACSSALLKAEKIFLLGTLNENLEGA